MAAIAAFASSDAGKLYGTVCQNFGVDPAAGFSDDVVAFNLRAALVLTQAQVDEAPPEPQVIGRQVIGNDPLEGIA